MGQICGVERVYYDLAALLADPQVDAVVIAVADAFHVPLAKQVLAAGKHVLVEKPLGLAVEECEGLREPVARAGRVFQIGNNRRFWPGLQAAKRFIDGELGRIATFNGWYYDSTERYTMQDCLYPVPVVSANAVRPPGDQKANRQRYILTTHAPHVFDTARWLCGPIVAVRARHTHVEEQHCWSIELEFAGGALGNIALISPRRGDFEEGLRVHGEFGSVEGKTRLPWFQTAAFEFFKDGEYRRPLGAHSCTFQNQIEAFAATILDGAPQLGATLEDGIAQVRALVATSISTFADGRRVALAEATGGVRAAYVAVEGAVAETGPPAAASLAAD